jgi:hypothetical protein
LLGASHIKSIDIYHYIGKRPSEDIMIHWSKNVDCHEMNQAEKIPKYMYFRFYNNDFESFQKLNNAKVF